MLFMDKDPLVQSAGGGIAAGTDCPASRRGAAGPMSPASWPTLGRERGRPEHGHRLIGYQFNESQNKTYVH